MGAPKSTRSALVLLIPESEPIVGNWRRLHDPSASDGMPAHVTVLYPFKSEDELDADCLAALVNIFGSTDPFDLAFSKLCRFPSVLWAAPEPSVPINALTDAVFRTFPNCPPYEGKFADPIPHLTIAIEEEAVLDRVEATLSHDLSGSFRSRIDSCTLYVHREERWRPHTRFQLGSN